MTNVTDNNDSCEKDGFLGKLSNFFSGGADPFEATLADNIAMVSAPVNVPMVAPEADEHLEIKVTAQTLYGEARGQGMDGMTAVADVISNRVAAAKVYAEENGKPHPLFGNGTFSDCCQRPWQFSCWNQNDPNLPKLLHVTISDPHFLTAMQVATQAVKGMLVDETKAATHYYAKSMPTPPAWAKGLTPCANIGGQLFFNDVP